MERSLEVEMMPDMSCFLLRVPTRIWHTVRPMLALGKYFLQRTKLIAVSFRIVGEIRSKEFQASSFLPLPLRNSF